MRNKLMDIDTAQLTHPHALTLTMTHAPAHPRGLTRIIKQLRDMLTEKYAMEGWAYVVEFTGSRVPHLHALASFTTPPDAEGIRAAWLHTLHEHDTSATESNQHITHAHDPSGWLSYMSKTAGRSHSYYRTPHIPEHWTSTPRLYASTLPSIPAQRHALTVEQFRTVRDDMDAHALATTGKQPARFHDTRDEVAGRTVWGYRYTKTKAQNAREKCRGFQYKSVVRPYLLKEGAGAQENRPANLMVGRFHVAQFLFSEYRTRSPPPLSSQQTAKATYGVGKSFTAVGIAEKEHDGDGRDRSRSTSSANRSTTNGKTATSGTGRPHGVDIDQQGKQLPEPHREPNTERRTERTTEHPAHTQRSASATDQGAGP